MTITETKPKHTGIRQFELVQYVTGYLGEGDIETWPAQMQDQIYQALERLAERVQLPLCITLSYCAVEPGENEGDPEKFYVHVLVSEIVIADERTLNPKRIVRGKDATHSATRTRH